MKRLQIKDGEMPPNGIANALGIGTSGATCSAADRGTDILLTTDRLFSRATILCTAAIATFAMPAHANTSAAAAVDVSDAAKEAQSPLGNGDTQFRQLFASWQDLDIERSPQPAVAAHTRTTTATPHTRGYTHFQ